MHVVIVHSALSPDSSPDDRDAQVQADAVQGALARLGHTSDRLTCDLDLAAVRDRLRQCRPDMVFNLVESLAGTGRLIAHFPSLLDALGLRYSGCRAEAVFLTSNKLLAKSCMRAAGIPTPPWIDAQDRSAKDNASGQPDRWMIKSVWEHASIGLDQDAILDRPTPQSLLACLEKRAALLGGSCFAEAYIDGREFNLSLLDGPDGVLVLPPAEILFDGYGDEKARIVDYRAKWDETSFEYHHTPRSFDFGHQDRPLLERLTDLARACWDLFHLRGYARVDFRVDARNRPWILEVNANPCLSPDAGFNAALRQAAISFDKAVDRILDSSALPFRREYVTKDTLEA